jgi:hypothetical protein
MTSIMSSDQRKQLQQAASDSKEAETLERETAKPPSSAEANAVAAEIVIPKAPAMPSMKSPVVEARADVQAPAASEAPAKVAPPAAPAGMASWELVAFVLLAVAVAVALKT